MLQECLHLANVLHERGASGRSKSVSRLRTPIYERLFLYDVSGFDKFGEMSAEIAVRGLCRAQQFRERDPLRSEELSDHGQSDLGKQQIIHDRAAHRHR